jgi:hypothetical protein
MLVESKNRLFRLPAAPGHRSAKKQESYFYAESFSFVTPMMIRRIITNCWFYIKKILRKHVFLCKTIGFKFMKMFLSGIAGIFFGLADGSEVLFWVRFVKSY